MMKKFELRWTRSVFTRFFGELVMPGGIVLVPASLAVQKHDENDGWECLDIEGARAELEQVRGISITADEIQKALSVDNVENVQQQSEPVSSENTGSGSSAGNYRCEECGQSFQSKKKLVAHISQAHQNTEHV
jgi:hypothetical protein